MAPHPPATRSQPVCIRTPAALALPRAFVLRPAGIEREDRAFARWVERIRADPAWRFRKVAVEHIGLQTTP